MASQTIAMVLGGMTLAFLLGIPVGSLVGELFGWRATFVFAALLSGVACDATALWLPRVSPAAAVESSRAEWGRALPLVIMTLLSFAATMAVVSYIGPVVEVETGTQGSAAGIFQAVIGIGALFGLVLRGRVANGQNVRMPIVAAFVVILVGQLIHYAGLEGELPGGLPAMMLAGWAVFSSAFALFAIMPIVQAKLVSIASSAAALLLAVNGSMNYLGQGLGAGLGGLAIRSFGVPSVALLGAALGCVGLLVAASYNQGRFVAARPPVVT